MGFDEKEADIYLALLSLGDATVAQIAKRSGVERTTLYPLLEKLQKKQIITRTRSAGAIIRFSPEDPEKIYGRVREYEERLKNSLPVLKAMQRRAGSTPYVTFYEGPDAYRTVLEEILLLPARTEILSFMSLKNIWSAIPEDVVQNFYKKRALKQISARVIAVNSSEARQLVKNAAVFLRSIRLIPSYLQFPSHMEIYGNRVGIISYEKQFMSVVIESEHIAAMQRAAFELMWDGAKKYEKDLPSFIYPNEIIL